MADIQRVGGRYGIEAEVGSGPVATVHRGRLTGGAGFTRRVALKRLTPRLAQDAVFVEDLAKGLSVLMGFPHTHVENTLDLFREDEDVWQVVEWCDGPSLTSWVEAHHEQGTPAPYGQLVAIAAKTLYGLHGLHSRGLSHGAVGAAAIRIDRSGQPRLTRAGICSALRQSGHDPEWAENEGLLRATPEGRPGVSADIFAVGLLLYTVLAGATDVAFLPEELRERLMTGRPVDLSLLRADVPPVLLRTIERALRSDPRERFDSAAIMARTLELLLRTLPENVDPPVIGRGILELSAAKAAAKPAAKPAAKKPAGATSGGPPPPPPNRSAPKAPPPPDSVERPVVDEA
ncbi:MAG: serine/threonine protein kinase [Sandaracinaceae bacterium]